MLETALAAHRKGEDFRLPLGRWIGCVFFFTLLGWFFRVGNPQETMGFCSHQMFFPAKYPLTNPMTFGGWLGKNDKNDLRPKCVCMCTWPIQFFCMTNPGQSNPLTNPVFLHLRTLDITSPTRMGEWTTTQLLLYMLLSYYLTFFLHFFGPFFQIATPIFHDLHHTVSLLPWPWACWK